MMDRMNEETVLSPRDLYRHRYAFERIKKGTLYGANQIGSMFAALRLPAEFEPVQRRLHSVLEILGETLQDLKRSQIGFQTKLRPLSAELHEALRVLDRNLVVYEGAAHRWLISSCREPGTEEVRTGEWVYINQSVCMSFQFRKDLDPSSAEVAQLCLDWRFPYVECRLGDEAHIETRISSPLFKFGQWADDHDPVDRAETAGLHSELLRAFLPHVPELAFLASYVSSCTLTLYKGKEWHASLLPVNTGAKPAFQR